MNLIEIIPIDRYTNDPVHAKLSTLLEWATEDPVDEFEMNRNEVVYSYQNNRNPYIDHPEYIDRIFGENASVGDISNGNKINVYPNPTSEYITIETGSNEAVLELFNGFGKLVLSQELMPSKQIYVGHLAIGVYVYIVIEDDDVSSRKILVE